MAFAIRNSFGFPSFFDSDFGFFSEPAFRRCASPQPRRTSPSCSPYGRCNAVPQVRRQCCSNLGSSVPSYAAVASAAPTHVAPHHASSRSRGGNFYRAMRPSSILAPASVFELLNIGSDFQRLWDDFEDVYDTANLLENTSFRDTADASPTEPKAVEAAAPSSSTVASSNAKSEVATVGVNNATPLHRFGEIATRTNTEDGSTQFDVQLPGLTSDDVSLDLDLDKHSLTIKAEKKFEDKNSFRHVSVTRVLPIDQAVGSDNVKADFVNGILHITVGSPSKLVESAPSAVALPTEGTSTTSPSEVAIPTEDPAAAPSNVDLPAATTSEPSSVEAPAAENTIATPASAVIDDSSDVSVEDAEEN